MTRSRKRYPIGGNTKADSDKAWKRMAHRATRKRTRQAIATGRFDALPVVREVMPVWAMPKDGKQWNRWRQEKEMRK